MNITADPDEPMTGPWRVASIPEVILMLVDAADDPAGRPRIVAIDGHGGARKVPERDSGMTPLIRSCSITAVT